MPSPPGNENPVILPAGGGRAVSLRIHVEHFAGGAAVHPNFTSTQAAPPEAAVGGSMRRRSARPPG
jgi:hypothetical protein